MYCFALGLVLVTRCQPPPPAFPHPSPLSRLFNVCGQLVFEYFRLISPSVSTNSSQKAQFLVLLPCFGSMGSQGRAHRVTQMRKRGWIKTGDKKPQYIVQWVPCVALQTVILHCDCRGIWEVEEVGWIKPLGESCGWCMVTRHLRPWCSWWKMPLQLWWCKGFC